MHAAALFIDKNGYTPEIIFPQLLCWRVPDFVDTISNDLQFLPLQPKSA